LAGRILEWLLIKWLGKYRMESTGSGQRPVAESREHGNELSGTLRDREFID